MYTVITWPAYLWPRRPVYSNPAPMTSCYWAKTYFIIGLPRRTAADSVHVLKTLTFGCDHRDLWHPERRVLQHICCWFIAMWPCYRRPPDATSTEATHDTYRITSLYGCLNNYYFSERYYKSIIILPCWGFFMLLQLFHIHFLLSTLLATA